MGMFLRRGRVQTSSSELRIVIDGATNANNAYVSIDGVKHSEATELKVKAGTVITIYTAMPFGQSSSVRVELNGSTVAGGTSSTNSVTYNYTVEKPSAISFVNYGLTFTATYACFITTL